MSRKDIRKSETFLGLFYIAKMRVLALILVFFMVLSFFAPVDIGTGAVNAAGKISISANSILVIKKGHSYKLKVKVKTTGKISKKVRYFSNNE
ncbi:MAG: hypothetical protein IKH94_08460, partial [Eubacterium sp.]|nr:hypothetical protein [Eubacterium sp.]